MNDFYEKKRKVPNKKVYLVLHDAGAFQLKKDSPFYRLMKRMTDIGVIVIAAYKGSSELKGRNSDVVNQADIKIIFKASSATYAEQLAKEVYYLQLTIQEKIYYTH